MSLSETPARKRARQAAAAVAGGARRGSLADRVKRVANQFLEASSAVTVPAGGNFGLESISQVVPVRNTHFNAQEDGDLDLLVRELRDLDMSDRHIEGIAEEALNLFDSSYNAQKILRDPSAQDGNFLGIEKVVGRSMAPSAMSNFEEGPGLEMFGDDINRLNTDDRLTMSLIIMRPWENIMDKGLARVNDSSPVVTIRIPAPEAYDWAKTQDQSLSTELREGRKNTNRLRDLYRNPTPVNTAPKKVLPRDENDSKNVLFDGANNPEYIKTGVTAWLKDLAKDAAVFGYGHSDRSDLIADGGKVDKIVFALTDGTNTENFVVDTRVFDTALFTHSPMNRSSTQRQVMLEAIVPLRKETKTFAGATSALLAPFTDAKIFATVTLAGQLDIATGQIQLSGSANLELAQLDAATPISPASQTAFGELSAAPVAYRTDLTWDEENQRKANLSIWVRYSEQQFIIPRSRVFFTEYSLTQEMDDNAVAATSSIVALGNGSRGLDIIVNALNDTADALQVAAQDPELASVNSLDEQSFAASLVKPTVVTTSIDFDQEQVNNMNESTRLVEMHGRFRARVLSMLATLFADSLMLNQYKGGETPVIKMWVHSTIADIVIGIDDYHPDLKDQERTASGADYSMKLPNGYRLDIIKSNFDCLKERIYALPVIESDMSSLISGASIRDCGTVTTNYTPTNNGSVLRRVATTTREIVMVSNKVGLCIEVKGIGKQLGVFTHAPLPLSPRYSIALPQ